MPTIDTVNKLKRDANYYCSSFLVRTDKYPFRVVSFGYLKEIKKWRMNVAREYNGIIINESTVDSINCNDLLDLAFEACENTRARLNIVINEIDARFY